MKFKGFVSIAAAISMVTLSFAAQAQQVERAQKPTQSENQLGGENAFFGLAVLAAAAVGIFLLADQDDASISN